MGREWSIFIKWKLPSSGFERQISAPESTTLQYVPQTLTKVFNSTKSSTDLGLFLVSAVKNVCKKSRHSRFTLILKHHL